MSVLRASNVAVPAVPSGNAGAGRHHGKASKSDGAFETAMRGGSHKAAGQAKHAEAAERSTANGSSATTASTDDFVRSLRSAAVPAVAHDAEGAQTRAAQHDAKDTHDSKEDSDAKDEAATLQPMISLIHDLRRPRVEIGNSREPGETGAGADHLSAASDASAGKGALSGSEQRDAGRQALHARATGVAARPEIKTVADSGPKNAAPMQADMADSGSSAPSVEIVSVATSAAAFSSADDLRSTLAALDLLGAGKGSAPAETNASALPANDVGTPRPTVAETPHGETVKVPASKPDQRASTVTGADARKVDASTGAKSGNAVLSRDATHEETKVAAKFEQAKEEPSTTERNEPVDRSASVTPTRATRTAVEPDREHAVARQDRDEKPRSDADTNATGAMTQAQVQAPANGAASTDAVVASMEPFAKADAVVNVETSGPDGNATSAANAADGKVATVVNVEVSTPTPDSETVDLDGKLVADDVAREPLTEAAADNRASQSDAGAAADASVVRTPVPDAAPSTDNTTTMPQTIAAEPQPARADIRAPAGDDATALRATNANGAATTNIMASSSSAASAVAPMRAEPAKLAQAADDASPVDDSHDAATGDSEVSIADAPPRTDRTAGDTPAAAIDQPRAQSPDDRKDDVVDRRRAIIPAVKADDGADANDEADAPRQPEARTTTTSTPAISASSIPAAAQSQNMTVASAVDGLARLIPGQQAAAKTTTAQPLVAQPAATQSLQIQLRPESMGLVTATLRMHGDKLTVEMTTERAEAYEKLKGETHALTKSLREMGLQVDQIVVQPPQTVTTPATRTDAGAGFSASADQRGQQPQFAAGEGASGQGSGSRQRGDTNGENDNGSHARQAGTSAPDARAGRGLVI